MFDNLNKELSKQLPSSYHKTITIIFNHHKSTKSIINDLFFICIVNKHFVKTSINNFKKKIQLSTFIQVQNAFIAMHFHRIYYPIIYLMNVLSVSSSIYYLNKTL